MDLPDASFVLDISLTELQRLLPNVPRNYNTSDFSFPMDGQISIVRATPALGLNGGSEVARVHLASVQNSQATTFSHAAISMSLYFT
jgi:hypothetical protein